MMLADRSLETLEALVRKSQRPGVVPLRRAFVQGLTEGRVTPGPLAALTSAGDRLGLDLYLTALMVASAEPHAAVLDGRVWARALGLRKPSGPQAISRAWSRLARLGLVRRERAGRLAKVTVLREDGGREHYKHPGEGVRGEPYFKLPVAYWTQGYIHDLSLPAKAMLMVAQSLRAGFVLPITKVRPWYGLSEDTAWRGLRELKERGLIEHTSTSKPAPLAPQGYAEVRKYRLLGVFDREWTPDMVALGESVPAITIISVSRKA